MCSLSRVMSAGECAMRCRWRAVPDPVEHPGVKNAGSHPSIVVCSIAVLSSSGRTCRGTSCARRGRPGLCGVLPRCCWARLLRVQRLDWVGEGAQGVLVWAISSCLSGRSMAPPGRHQAGRCKRAPCGSSWWWWMCSEEQVRPPPPVWWQLRPTDTAMAARSVHTSSEEESRSTDEDEGLLTKRCIEGQ